MQITSVKDVTLQDFKAQAGTLIAACGYEARCSAIANAIAGRVDKRVVIGFKEWPEALSRRENEKIFERRDFRLHEAGGSETNLVGDIVKQTINSTPPNAPVIIDVSCMTRAWHGAIVRTLRSEKFNNDVEIIFAYSPAKFSSPPRHSPAYEILAPVDGFASLSPPDLPIAAIVGLGYERERALGLQQLLDPKKTILLVPRFRSRIDRFYPAVLKSNRDILSRTSADCQFEYWIDEPSSTYGLLARLVSQLLPSYRIVLASLGPKLLGVICFLLATQYPQVSVWRASLGIHGKPRQSVADVGHTVAFSVKWAAS